MTNPKTTLRDQARKYRTTHDVLAEDIEAATPLFFDRIAPQQSQIIAAYWPKGREFDPTHILEQALAKGFTCALPKVEPNTKILKFTQYTCETKLIKGAYGIMEPSDGAALQPDIILCPMLSFDRAGYRLGQGGGYYDATLAHLRAQKAITAIGIGYAAQAVLFNLPHEPHDQKMDYILTPQGIIDHTSSPNKQD